MYFVDNYVINVNNKIVFLKYQWKEYVDYVDKLKMLKCRLKYF